MTEQVDWIKTSDELPDCDTTVLMFIGSGSEPVWIGYFDDDRWRFADGSSCQTPLAWADLPAGPKGII